MNRHFYGIPAALLLSSGSFAQFGPSRVIPDIVGVNDVVVNDLDQDGDPDLVIGTSTEPNLGFIENLGNWHFAPAVDLSDDGIQRHDVLVVDLDQDGDRDIVTASDYNDYIIFYRNEAGAFTDQILSAPQGELMRLAAGDLDGDGDLDIMVSGLGDLSTGGRPTWLENDGTYSGQWNEQHLVDTTYDSGGRDIELVDVEPDGDLDLVSATDVGANGLLLYRNDGTGEAFIREQIMAVQGSGLVMGDVDGDGDPDIVHTSFWDNRTVWIANEGGTFGAFIEIDTGLEAPTSPTLADMDNDGRLDLLVASAVYPFGDVVWFRGSVSGAFLRITAAQALDYPELVVTGDLDRDGAQDLVLTTHYAGQDLLLKRSYAPTPYTLSGDVFWDEDEDGMRDPLETGFAHVTLSNEAFSSDEYATDNGDFRIYADSGWTTVSATPNDSLWTLSTDSASFTRHVGPQDSAVTGLRFGFRSVVDTLLGAVVYSSEPTRCGFTIDQWLDVSNGGTRKMNGWLALTLDTLMTFVSALPEPDSSAAGTLFWRILELPPYATFGVQLVVLMPGPEYIGTQLSSTTQLLGEDGQGTLIPLDETALVNPLTCSYDPNDKLVQPGYGPPGGVDMDTEWLTYTVRFQNTGNDTAFSVLVCDRLDTLTLQPNSMQVMGTSHTLTQATLGPDGAALFRFEDILLPDSGTNEPASHGLLLFRVRLREALPAGTEVRNAAEIYFDFNPAVVTDTIMTTLRDCDAFTASITLDDWHALTASEGAVFQWYFEGLAIAGATSAELVPGMNGMYSVMVTNELGCVATSGGFPFYSVGLSAVNHGSGAVVVPDPVTSSARIVFEWPIGPSDAVELIDPLGGLHQHWAGNGSRELALDREGLAPGPYFIRVIRKGLPTHSIGLVVQ